MKKYNQYIEDCWNEINKKSTKTQIKHTYNNFKPTSFIFITILCVITLLAIGTRPDANPTIKHIIELLLN